MKHYHYLTLLSCSLLFANCKKDNIDFLRETASESQQKKANEETWTYLATQTAPIGIWLVDNYDIYADMNVDFLTLQNAGLPYHYFCKFCYSTTRPQPWGWVFDHSLYDPTGIIRSSYEKLGSAVNYRDVNTSGMSYVTVGSEKVRYYVVCNSTYYGEHYFTSEIKLRRGGI